MKTRRLFTFSACLLLLAARVQAAQCRYHLADQSDGATSGVDLALEAKVDASGKCQLSAVTLNLTLGDGAALHSVSAPFSWQTGIVYTAKATITAAGPQQLSINGQSSGSVQGGFKPVDAMATGSEVDDSGAATETYIVSQISLEISNGSNTLNVAPNGNNPIPIPLILLAGGPAPWQISFTENPAQTTIITATFRFDPLISNPHQFDPYIDVYGQAVAASWPSKIASDGDLQATVSQERAWLAQNEALGGLDQYGGSTAAGWTDKATGYYRTALHAGHWYLISPLGNPLFYIGITAIGNPQTPITGRESMFQLPPASGSLAAAYFPQGNTTNFSYLTANQIRKYGSSYKDVQNTLFHQRLASWGFAGGGKFGAFPGDLPMMPILAHGGAAGVPLAVPGGHPDIWDPAVVSKLTTSLKAEMGTDIANPYVIGWSVGNESEESIQASEIQGILTLGASSPAKRALVNEALSANYGGSVSGLAAAWKITASTVSDVYAAINAQPPGSDIKLLRHFYQQAYFATLYQTVKSIDPNHLYFGTWVLPAYNQEDFPLAAPNCDVVGFDDFTPGPLGADIQGLIANANKPVMLGAWGVPSDYGGARGFGWNQDTMAMTLSDAASGDAYSLRLESLASNMYMVGAMLFEYNDDPLTGSGPLVPGEPASDLVIGSDRAFGLVDVTDTPKFDLVNRVRGANIAALQSLGLLGSAPALTSAPANGATYVTGGLVPGSWAQVKGTNLSGITRIWQDSDFAGLGNSLPTNVGGVQVLVNGTASAVYYISPTQISFQVPAGVSGTANVQVIRDGLVSNTMSGTAVSSAPGIFPIILNGTNYAAGVFPDGKIAGDPSVSPAFRKARPGDVISLYATGLAPSAAGTTVSLTQLTGVTATIGNITVDADFAGLVAVGEFQINVTVPQQFANLPEGNYPITISVNGVSSPSTINSDPPAPIVLPIQR